MHLYLPKAANKITPNLHPRVLSYFLSRQQLKEHCTESETQIWLHDARERLREFRGISLAQLDAAQWSIGGHRLIKKYFRFPMQILTANINKYKYIYILLERQYQWL